MKWTVSRKMADSYMEKRNELKEQILHCRSELSKIFLAVLVQSIYAKIQDANSKLFNHLQQIKAQKVDQLIGPQIIRDSSPEIRKTAVTIPEKPNWISNPKNRGYFFRKPKTYCQRNENPQTNTETKSKNRVFQGKNWKPDLKNGPKTENLKALFSKGSKFL